VRSSLRTCIAEAEKLSNAEELKSAQEAVVVAISSIDKAVRKGVIHRNKGARLKSRLMRRLSAFSEKGGS
jgi:small subunit ribosomal protein S20